jgi:hypothetical protein
VERALFESRFRAAAAKALEIARASAEEVLPDALQFRIRLPDDQSPKDDVSFERAVDLLWREGRVPHWVHLSVIGRREEASIVEVIVPRRIMDDASQLSDRRTEFAPFRVGESPGPDRAKVSIHHRSTCRSQADLDYVLLHAAKVGFLDLEGTTFDDGFTNLGIERFPKLRSLRLDLADATAFDFGELAHPTLEWITLEHLPKVVNGVARFGRGMPRLETLVLDGRERTTADGELSASLRRLRITMPTVPEWIVPSSSLRELEITAPEADDASVRSFLERCPVELQDIMLHGTPVTDAMLEVFERFTSLRSAGGMNTRASMGGILAAFPGLTPTFRVSRDPGPN